MGGSSIFTLGKAAFLNDDDHMMRCKNYNGNEGIIYREVDRPGQQLQLSSSAKADDPVNAAVSIPTNVPAYWMPRRSLSSGGVLRRPVGGA
jgi:hypothetical protein